MITFFLILCYVILILALGIIVWIAISVWEANKKEFEFTIPEDNNSPF